MGKIVSFTSEELAAKTSMTDWARVKREYDSGVDPAFDEENPDVSERIKVEIERLKRGRVLGSGAKASQTVRFDVAILEAFKSTGKGWQTRMNDALRTYLKEHPMNHPTV